MPTNKFLEKTALEIEEEYARILLEIADTINRMSNRAYDYHQRKEAFKRSTPHLHEANGMDAARNVVVEAFNKYISEETRTKLAKEYVEKKKPEKT